MSLLTKCCQCVPSVTFIILFVLFANVHAASDIGNCDKCKFTKHKARDSGAEERLKPICGRRYVLEDGEYFYNLGICVTAEHDAIINRTTAAVTQRKKATNKDEIHSLHVIGDINSAEIMSGTNWINLEYEDGDKYGHSCNEEKRRASIMITCLPGELVGVPKLLQENHNKTEDCYYLFELGHDAACSKVDNTTLSAGSIICIVLAFIVAAYLIIGGLYMRCVVGAKGLHQIPNFEFWKDFGNLQADGCDLICRCGGGKDRGSQMYHGIGDHQIECANDDHDEHLLPM